ncbi:LAQU0S15e00166g1_1 [Lachancea quebecensis]|uniref:LAQU0S15e00166g1_1 n=1 Tax=Lachancea quebecensis TaxID=1654605 RepID=A0A0P1KWC9_9SACH|nr:LAQU0S15e00166g1_1 [Lachancea quebecensis]
MDLIDNLRTKNRRNGTTKKLNDLEQNHIPAVSGTGFLFENSVLRRVKSRLQTNDENHGDDSDKRSQGNAYCDLSQTQVVRLAYDGEDLEQDFVNATTHIEEKRRAGPTNKLHHPQSELQVSSTITKVEGAPSSSGLESTEVCTQLISRQTEESGDLDTQLFSPDVELERVNENLNNAILDGSTTQTSELDETVHDDAIQATSKDENDIAPLLPATNKTKHSNDGISLDMNSLEKQSNCIAMSSTEVGECDKANRKRFDAQSFIKSFEDETDGPLSSAGSTTSETKKPALNRIEDGEQNSNYLKELSDIESNRESELGKSSASIKIYPTVFKEKLQDASAVVLSSSSEEEEDYESKTPSFKAAILDLKARLSKKRQGLLTARAKNTTNFSSHQVLFASLRKANKGQILEHRREKYQSKGIDYDKITEEKNTIESLLERELARNKKLRLKEIQRERENDSMEFDGQSSAFDYSDDEIEGESSDEEIDEGESSSHGSLHSEKEGVGEAVESATIQAHISKQVNSNEEDDIIRKSGSKKRKKFCLVETDEEDVSTVNPGNIIDLGSYGNNIEELNKIKQERMGEHRASQRGDGITVGRHKENTIKPASCSPSFGVADLSNESIDPNVIREFREKRKRRELLIEAKLEKLHQSKASGMIDYEAEESDDEWHGIGGVDGERFDDYDSDLEKMIDDYSNSKFDSSEVRKKQIEEEITEDKSMVNKILHDIETGGFRKRGRNALDLEFSDDEDDELIKYHARRKELLRQKASAQGEAKLFAENPKSKAFFETIIEDLEPKGSLEKKEFTSARESSFVIASGEDFNDIDQEGKKPVLSEAFVHETLSFLKSGEFGGNIEAKDTLFLHSPTHASGINTQEAQDVFALKQNSSIKNLSAPTRKNSEFLIDDQEDTLSRKMACPLFARFTKHVDVNEKFEEGKKTVRSLNSYKAAGSSKASITYLGKARKLNARKRAVRQNSRKKGQKPVTGFGIFASDSKSFES